MKLRDNTELWGEIAALVHERDRRQDARGRDEFIGLIIDAVDRALATPSPETGTAAVPPRFDGEDYLRAMPGGHAMPAGPAPDPVKPPAHPLFPDPRTVCKPCDGTGRDTRVPANGWDVACSACNGTGRTPAAGTAPKGGR